MIPHPLNWFGIAAKFSVLPDYFTPSFMLDWTIARFSIQAEQAYNYLSGESIIGRDVQYLELVLNAFSNRLDLVLGDPVFFSYPRSLSEALLFDMTGGYGGGSSPGVLLNTILQGPFFFMVPLMLSVIFMQFFYGFKEKFSLLKIAAYSFLFKGLHANFSEYFTLISPTIVLLVFFVFASLLNSSESYERSKDGL